MGDLALNDVLRPVSVTEDELYDLVGSSLDGKVAYLVGSLAAGLGNASSDIDIHVFEGPEAAGASGTPSISFLKGTTVDVRRFQASDVAEELDRLSPRSAPLASGRCALGSTLSRQSQARLGRWVYSKPLGDALPLISPAVRESVVASSVRGAVADYLILCGLAHAYHRTSEPDAEVEAGAWRKVARGLLEVHVRLAGNVYVGRKWVWRRGRAAGVPGDILQQFDAVASHAALAKLEEEMGYDGLSELSFKLAVTRPRSVTRRALTIGGAPVELVDERWILDQMTAEGDLLSVLEAADPKVTLVHLAYGSASVSMNEGALDAWLEQS